MIGENSVQTERIAAIRKFNRFYTRHLGVLEEGYLQSEFSLTEARIVYELAQADYLTATQLQSALGHDAGYLSRVLRRLGEANLIRTSASPTDGREKLLSLTPQGRNAFDRIDRRSRDQIDGDLSRLSSDDRRILISSMMTIEDLLNTTPESPSPFTLRSHRPGDMGWVIQRHGEIYAREYGWNDEFEALVAEIAADFLRNFDPMMERCWIAEYRGERVGSVFLVKHPDRDGVAKLRLLLVDPAARGMGIGKCLVDECTRFATEAGYRTITLWTNSVLSAARNIYRSAGYELTEEEPHRSFGHDLISETWELHLERTHSITHKSLP